MGYNSYCDLAKEAAYLAKEAFNGAEGDFEDAHEYLMQICDNHEAVIYYHKAIKFCAKNDTSNGEAWLEDCGGIAQDGDTFGDIACRIAYATLVCEATEILRELCEDHADAAEEAELCA